MKNNWLEHNLDALRTRDSSLSDRIRTSSIDVFYSGIKLSKEQLPVPIHFDGSPFHSLYDPVKEAKKIIDTLPSNTFVFFTGIAGGFHIREYLSRFTNARCIIAETTINVLSSLLRIADFSDILSNPNVLLIPDCSEKNVSYALLNSYFPALHGGFQVVAIRTWEDKIGQYRSEIKNNLQTALDIIMADFSVQAHFGKIWLRNFLRNCRIMENMHIAIPKADIKKTALIGAAGPSLEIRLNEIKKNRNKYCIFSTDTAFSVFYESGITPDFLVSIDAQAISASHVMKQLPVSMTVFLDVCGNPGIAQQALSSGCNLVFTAGSHPLARYAASFSVLPMLDTSSGTVTIAAVDAAHALGFTNIQCVGADFGYVQGKPYARGTYLSDIYGAVSNRLQPQEHMFCALMFRTKVMRTETKNGIDYGTETLERYRQALINYRSNILWVDDDFKAFAANAFLEILYKEWSKPDLLNSKNNPALYSILPFIAWYSEPGNAIKLALDLIAGYTR